MEQAVRRWLGLGISREGGDATCKSGDWSGFTFATCGKNEAQDFTGWLQTNIDALSEALDLELSVVEREKDVGSFAADILASDSSGRTVVIENQIERTDHDHLGKVLTYLTNLEAKTAIRVELYIDRGSESTAENKAIFDQLMAKRQEIEEVFGRPLKWERLDGKRACRISASLGVGGPRDVERWASIQDAMIDAMVRLHKALKGPIDALGT